MTMSEAPAQTRRPVRIANCSGFFGDRVSAAAEMVNGGPIDVLTGDWLAELTMLILARQRLKHGEGAGWARTFATQMRDVLPTCLERGIKVVSNAGGLDPEGAAAALREWADSEGLSVSIATVTGDDLTGQLADLRESGEALANFDTGETLDAAGVQLLTANAYLGAAGIVAALDAGADVVITGRVTDAALVIGPAAWWHGWSLDAARAGDQQTLDALAGALVAGHVIECGTQATGGNYSFFTDVPGAERIGFPIAEVASDGTCVITKHDGDDDPAAHSPAGGLVSPGTVTAQLLYELGGPAYLNPDVTARFDTIRCEQVGRDRLRISGVRGEQPPHRLKVAANYLGGFRNSATLVITGLNPVDKAELALQAALGIGLDELASGMSATELATVSALPAAELHVRLGPDPLPDPESPEDAQTHLVITVKDADPAKVGKAFTAPIVESALASYPGMFPTAPPAEGTPYGVYWPTTVDAAAVTTVVRVDGHEVSLADASAGIPAGVTDSAVPDSAVPDSAVPASAASGAGDAAQLIDADEPVERAPLGTIVGARSGDKGGSANIGVWIPDPVEPQAVALAWGEVDTLTAPSADELDVLDVWAEDEALAADSDAVTRADQAYAWLAAWLTADQVRALLPEVGDLPVEVYPLPNLRAVNIVIRGLLGRGVADSTRSDPQAKGLAEHLRARYAQIPVRVLPPGSDDAPWADR